MFFLSHIVEIRSENLNTKIQYLHNPGVSHLEHFLNYKMLIAGRVLLYDLFFRWWRYKKYLTIKRRRRNALAFIVSMSNKDLMSFCLPIFSQCVLRRSIAVSPVPYTTISLVNLSSYNRIVCAMIIFADSNSARNDVCPC